MVENHTHDGVSGNKLVAQDALVGAPQEALTAPSGGSLSSGGSGDLKTTDADILNNLITRVNELEDKLQALTLLK
jgi:hypothetical protein